jgi:alpha-L-fucosidase 2
VQAAVKFAIVATLALSSVAARASDEVLWFDRPADYFTEALPMGSGRLGASLFGFVGAERLVLNETGMWSGSPQNSDRPGAVDALPEIRRLIFEGKNLEAQNLAQERFTATYQGGRITANNVPRMAPGAGSINQFGCYQALGNLWLKFKPTEAQDYRRELDLRSAVAKVNYNADGVRYTREAFVSAPDEVIVLRLTADQPGEISFEASLTRPEKFQTVGDGPAGLLMTGQLENGVDGNGTRYAARLQVQTKGGKVVVKDGVVRVEGADEATLFVAALTDIKTFAGRRADDPARVTAEDLKKASAKSYDVLRRAHVADYRKYYDRVSLDFGPDAEETLTTPARLAAFHQGAVDPGLVKLYFNFVRYLLISCSRPGGLPPTLVGLWTEDIQTAWNGDWHLDINLEMNYWPVEVANLSDLFRPFFDFVASLQKPGAKTAANNYGARGWVVHAVSNPWGFTSPGWRVGWGTYTSGAWLSQILWDHYVYTPDRKYLEEVYPVLRGSAQFYSDVLVEEPRRKWLVTAPSNSPENPFVLPNGDRVLTCAGPTMDNQQIRHLFGAVIEASRLLGRDAEFRAKLEEQRARLAPTRVASDGRIMEWLDEYAEGDPQHRVIAHLWGLYPGIEITARGTPELAAAAKKSLEGRGERSCGYTIANKVAMWARLGETERAYQSLRTFFTPVDGGAYSTIAGGGTYPNLLNACPPFMIEGNLGSLAAIIELLLQSHEGDINLLAALPKAWPDGQVKGLRARGGFEVDMTWKNGALTGAAVRSTAEKKCTVRYGEKSVTLEIPIGGEVRLDGNLQKI